jgi:hypothetical protein
MQIITPLYCPINEHLGVYLLEEIKGQITLLIMPLPNHYITPQHSHGVITNFHDLHMFLCQTNQRLMCVSCCATSIWEPAPTMVRPLTFLVRRSLRRHLGLRLAFSPDRGFSVLQNRLYKSA